jgi:hypothetical protein
VPRKKKPCVQRSTAVALEGALERHPTVRADNPEDVESGGFRRLTISLLPRAS